LQWTMDSSHSSYSWIRKYFNDFLKISPIMFLKERPQIFPLENWLFVAEWDYIFEIDDVQKPWERKQVEAHFTFTIEQNPENNKWSIAGLHSYYNTDKIAR
jgi:hypothetical protein